MTKERLEELIKQGATICIMWHPSSPKETLQIKLDSKKYKIDYPYLKRNGKILCLFKQLYELKEIELIIEQAEWHLKTYAERTERFEPPMWEEINGYYCFTFVIDNYPMWFSVEKGNSIMINSSCCDNIFEKYASDVTKENYEKACEIVRDLFKGEK